MIHESLPQLSTNTTKRHEIIKIHQEKRFKVIYIDYNIMMNLFNWKQTSESIILPKINVKIEDCIIIRIDHCIERLAFSVIIGHINFEPIKPNEQIPELIQEIKVVQVQIPMKHLPRTTGLTTDFWKRNLTV